MNAPPHPVPERCLACSSEYGRKSPCCQERCSGNSRYKRNIIQQQEHQSSAENKNDKVTDAASDQKVREPAGPHSPLPCASVISHTLATASPRLCAPADSDRGICSGPNGCQHIGHERMSEIRPHVLLCFHGCHENNTHPDAQGYSRTRDLGSPATPKPRPGAQPS